MKILYLITQSSWGGAQKYVFDLARALKEKHEVAVACGGDGELPRRLREVNVKVIPLKYLRRDISFFSEIKGYSELKKLLKAEKPEILHLNSSKAGVLGSLAARKLPVKVVYTVHGAVFTAAFNRLYQLAFKLVERGSSKYKDRIIAVSENDRQLWLKNKVCEPEKIVTIRNGIDLDGEADMLAKDQAKKALNINNDARLVIGIVANFYAEKNYLFLIRSFAELLKSMPEAELIIIGEGRERSRIAQEIKALSLNNKVALLGFIPDAMKYVRAFDVFVLPSIKEGLPGTLLEAQLAKVPIVASDVGGIPEIVSDDKTGLLFDSNDQSQFVDKIKKILLNQEFRAAIMENAYRSVKVGFDFKKQLEKTEEIYRVLSSADRSFEVVSDKIPTGDSI
ncbi:MAG: glycosyltransferase family 4 protein [Patescibacteria group bacterium]